MLGERYVVDVERWAGRSGARAQGSGPAATRSRRRGRWRRATAGCSAWSPGASSPRRASAASQFAPDQAVEGLGPHLRAAQSLGRRARLHLLRRRAAQGKLMFVTDRRQSNRQACLAMRPHGRRREDCSASSAQRRREREPALHEPPESLDVILADLDNIRLPWRDLYRAYTEPPAAAEAARGGADDDGQCAIARVARPQPARARRSTRWTPASTSTSPSIRRRSASCSRRAAATRAMRRAAGGSASPATRSSPSSPG